MKMDYPSKCLVCQEEVECLYEGDDDHGCAPNIVGGHIEIRFGYGSQFDSLPESIDGGLQKVKKILYQAIICDECFKDSKYIIRKIEVKQKRNISWKVLDSKD